MWSSRRLVVFALAAAVLAVSIPACERRRGGPPAPAMTSQRADLARSSAAGASFSTANPTRGAPPTKARATTTSAARSGTSQQPRTSGPRLLFGIGPEANLARVTPLARQAPGPGLDGQLAARRGPPGVRRRLPPAPDRLLRRRRRTDPDRPWPGLRSGLPAVRPVPGRHAPARPDLRRAGRRPPPLREPVHRVPDLSLQRQRLERRPCGHRLLPHPQ